MFLAVVLFLAYVVLRVVIGFLVDLSLGSHVQKEEPSGDPEDGDDPVEDVPGLHVLSDYGSRYGLVDKYPTEKSIRATIRSLDWVGGFHQVVLVTSPGVSLEVGGSLDPDDGLAAVYRHSKYKTFQCPTKPPATIENMEDLLVSFYFGDGRWKQMYDFE